MLATLLCSQGTPMVVADDEVRAPARRGGNGNAYCHDDNVGWVDREGRTERDHALTTFASRLIALRRSLRRRRWVEGNTNVPVREELRERSANEVYQVAVRSALLFAWQMRTGLRRNREGMDGMTRNDEPARGAHCTAADHGEAR